MDSNLLKNLPTDNLYKFIAIFGLVLFSLSFFIPGYYDKKISDYSNYIREEMNYFENNSSNSINSMKVSVDEMIKSREELSILILNNRNLYTKEKYKTFLDEYNILNNNILTAFDDLIATTKFSYETNINFNKSAIASYSQKTKEYSKESEILKKSSRFIGVIFIFLGFIFWYFKTQRYLDWILKNNSGEFKRKNWFKKLLKH